MSKEDAVELKIGELTQREEFGRGIIRIDSKSMQKLGVKEGEIIEIEGTKKTGAIAVHSYPSDAGLNIARIDGLERRNAGIGIGDMIKLKKVEVNDAKKIVLAPAQEGVTIHISPNILKTNMHYRPFSKGDVIVPSPVVKRRRDSDIYQDFFGFDLSEFFNDNMFTPTGEIRFVVTSTDPKGIVKVTEKTEIEVLKELPKSFDLDQKTIPSVTYEDVGGIHQAIQKVREMIELPLRHPELFTKLGIEPPKGVLLYGPPGTGKTLLARAVANESGANFYTIGGPEVMSMWYGKSEENLRKIFEEAEKNAPAIVFIDEIDSIAPKREDTKGEVERRVVSQLLTLMDGLNKRGRVIVIAATNRPNALDPALRRPGRFDREIEIGVPDRKGRREILQIHTRDMPLEKDVNIEKLTEVTYGYVGADLEALAKEAAMLALRRLLPKLKWKVEGQLPVEALEKLRVTEKDLENALKIVEPSAMREVLIEIPNIRWNEIGGLQETKDNLKESVEWPLKYPDSFEKLGIQPPRGILLYGPPGCGKTLMAKAVATESGANFISVKGPQILSMWVGESEKKLRDLFKRAKQVAPSIIFFDEIDSLAPIRGMGRGDEVTERIVSQMLTEMSGLEDLHDVVIIAATNRPDMIDPALLRPGRFDRQILVSNPDEEARLKILEIKTKKMPLEKVDLSKMAKETEGYSGADLEALAREAAMIALRKDKKIEKVTMKNFDEALKIVKPSLDERIIDFYKKFNDRMNNRVMKNETGKEPGYLG